MGKTTTESLKLNDTVRVVAHIHGVTPRQVRKVRNLDCENEIITETLIDFEQGVSKLIQELKKRVVITTNPAKYARQKN